MQLEQEGLIAEILGTSPTGDYCHWPRTAASPAGSPEMATLKSRLRKSGTLEITIASRAIWKTKPKPSMAAWRSSPAPGSRCRVRLWSIGAFGEMIPRRIMLRQYDYPAYRALRKSQLPSMRSVNHV